MKGSVNTNFDNGQAKRLMNIAEEISSEEGISGYMINENGEETVVMGNKVGKRGIGFVL